LGAISLISAENLTTNENVIINGTIDKQANCSEELIKCIDTYNSLLEDFREGINCGTAFNLVKGMNEVLAEERDNCREEIGKLKVYRVGFYILLVVLFITGIVIIVNAMKK
jgi:hypothetical protein